MKTITIEQKIYIYDFDVKVECEVSKCKDEEHHPLGSTEFDSFSFEGVNDWKLLNIEARNEGHYDMEFLHEIEQAGTTIEKAIEDALYEQRFNEIIEEIYN